MLEPLNMVASQFSTTVDELRLANPQLTRGYALLSSFDELVIPAAAIRSARGNMFNTRAVASLERDGRLRLVPAQGAPAPPSTSITVEQLALIIKPAVAPTVIDVVNLAMKEGDVNTRLRQAVFIGNTAHESTGYTAMAERGKPSYFDKYEPGTEAGGNVGNTKKGDGRRFMGRGMIQLTGRENYTRAWIYFGLPMKEDKKDKLLFRGQDPLNPELAAEPEWSARIAGWYWKVLRPCNDLADTLLAGKPPEEAVFRTICRKINGGLNGLDDRLNYYRKAKKVFGITGGTVR
jgi:putative chitinase